MIDHDRLFKELLTTFFWEFVEAFLPEVAEYLERESIIFLDKEIFTDVTAGDRQEVDLVVQGRFKGQDSCFLIHVEQQAQPQDEFGRRMFRYFARLHERDGLPIYPVVIFSHDRRKPEPDHYEVRFPDLRVLSFRFRVIQLGRMSWREFVNQPNPAVCGLMAKMNIAERDRPRVKLECLRLLTTLRLDPARTQLISGFIDTYLRLNAEEELRFREQAATLPGEQQKEEIMEIVTSWMEKGIEQGLEQGREQGLERGLLEQARADILDVLEARFGEAPYQAKESLPLVQDLAQLKVLLRQACTAAATADFLQALENRESKE